MRIPRVLALLVLAVLVGLLAPQAASADVTGAAVQGFTVQPTVVKYGDRSKGYQLDSSRVKEVFCQQKAAGFNQAVLTWPLYQHKQSSTKITLRAGAKDRAAAPTDAELVRAIRNAQDCGLKVVLKPHLEIDDNSWRGRIGAARWRSNNKAADAWQKSWNAWLVRYAKIAKKEKAVVEIVIGTEQWGTTLTSKSGTKFNKHNGKRWAKSAKKVKSTLGSTARKRVAVTYAAHTSYESRGLPKVFVRELTRLDLTWYPRVLTVDTSTAALQAEMSKDFTKYFDVVAKKYRKPIVFAEIGFPSVKADKQYLKRGSLTADDVDLGLQARRYRAALNLMDSRGYVKGVMLYRAENTTWSGGSHDPWLTWQNKPARHVIEEFLR